MVDIAFPGTQDDSDSVHLDALVLVGFLASFLGGWVFLAEAALVDAAPVGNTYILRISIQTASGEIRSKTYHRVGDWAQSQTTLVVQAGIPLPFHAVLVESSQSDLLRGPGHEQRIILGI